MAARGRLKASDYTAAELRKFVERNGKQQQERSKLIRGISYDGLDPQDPRDLLFTSNSQDGSQRYNLRLRFFDFANFAPRGRDEVINLLNRTDIGIHCDCPSFLYWGAAYKADQMGYGIVSERRAPKNPNKEKKDAFYACKHAQAVLRAMPFWWPKIRKDYLAHYDKQIKDLMEEQAEPKVGDAAIEDVSIIDVDNYVIGTRGIWYARLKGEKEFLTRAFCSADQGATWHECYIEVKSSNPKERHARTQAGKAIVRTPRAVGFNGPRTSIGMNVLTWYAAHAPRQAVDYTLHIDHKDDDYTNDQLSNLDRITPEENYKKRDARRPRLKDSKVLIKLSRDKLGDDEFSGLHAAGKVATQFIGKLKGELEKLSRDNEARFKKLQNKKAASAKDISGELKVFEESLPNLKKLYAAAQKDKTEAKEDYLNYMMIMKDYQRWWDELFIPYAQDILKMKDGFKNIEEMEQVIKKARGKINELLKIELVTEEESDKQKDASFATLTNNLSRPRIKTKRRL